MEKHIISIAAPGTSLTICIEGQEDLDLLKTLFEHLSRRAAQHFKGSYSELPTNDRQDEPQIYPTQEDMDRERDYQEARRREDELLERQARIDTQRQAAREETSERMDDLPF